LIQHYGHYGYLLRSLGLPEKIVGLMKELYTDTVSSVRVEGTLSNWFEIRSGVRQGCSIIYIFIRQQIQQKAIKHTGTKNK